MTEEQDSALLMAIGFLVAIYHGLPANPAQAKQVADNLALAFLVELRDGKLLK